MSSRRRIAIIAAAALVSGLLFIAFILPFIIRAQLEKQLAGATERRCSVGRVYLNPLNWSAEVVRLSLAEKNSTAAFVSFSSVKVKVSPTSVWHRAPVISGVTVASPYIHLQRNAANRYNFTDILEKQPKKKSGDPARFSLNNIVVTNGRVVFDDDALPRAQKHTIDRIAVQIPFVSNISYFADKYVDPRLSAVVNGAPLGFAGKLKPFEKGLEASLDINLHGVDIPYYAAYFPGKLPVNIVKGELSAGLRVKHQLVHDGKSDITISGVTAVRDLALTEPSGAQLLGLKSVSVDIAAIALLNHRYELAKLMVESPRLALRRSRDGVWSPSRLIAGTAAGGDKKSGQQAKSPGPDIIITSLQLVDGGVQITDDLPPGGSAVDLKNIGFSLANFASKGEMPAGYALSLVTGRREKAAVSGNIALEPLAVSGRITLSGLVLEAAYPYLTAFLNDPVRGRADFTGDLAFSREKGLSLEQFMLRLRGVTVPFGPSDGVSLPLLVAEGGSLGVNERKLGIEKITLSGGKVAVSREATGMLSSSLLVKTRHGGGAPPPPATGQQKPFTWQIGRVLLQDLGVSFQDRRKEEAPRFQLTGIKAELSSVTGPQLSEMPVMFSAKYGTGGTLSLGGRVTPAPFRFKGELGCSGIPFVDFDPYLPDGVNVTLVDGLLDTRLSLDLAVREGRPSGSFQGAAGIRDFYTVDGEEGNDLLKWESLLLEKFSGTLEPFTLSLGGLSLNNYYARVIVNKNGRINLQDIYKPPVKESAAAPPLPPGQQKEAKSRDIRIDSITLSDGVLDFSDYHLNREFSTSMLHLGGRISGLTSSAGTAADIDLRGNLENHSPLKITGRINPLLSDLFLDMRITFSDIELSPLTPYAGTYLGYVIDKGKLSLAMNYTVDKKSLTADNKVFIDQFTFGEAVESSKATSLPVRLAVALLKDKNGEIHLDLPLSGRTDSPKFSVWGLVGQVLKNLLVKAASSPLALLQSSFGGGDDFSMISFSPGGSRISAAEEEKLRSLAKALTERPGLRLEVSGFADRERDPEGYRNEMLERKMKSEKLLSLAKEKRESSGLKRESAEISAAEQPKWLKAVYEKEKFPKPRTAIGTLKTLPDNEMKKLILANTVVGEPQLRSLARERALAVMAFLVKEGRLPQERLFEKSADPFALPEKGAAAAGRVEFGVVAR